MKQNYLDAYYPDGISMEDRLFNEGARRTEIPINTWVTTLVVGFAMALFGLILFITSYDLYEFGMILFCLGDLVLIAGACGVGFYYSGFRYLERAELLYNTRVAGREEPAPKTQTGSATHTAAPQPVSQTPGKWVCVCGKQNADFTSVCTCGVTKAQAKQAVPAVAKGVRTANGWRCSCGKEHAAYVSSCSCGVNKRDIK